jgi:hypothetical protein
VGRGDQDAALPDVVSVQCICREDGLPPALFNHTGLVITPCTSFVFLAFCSHMTLRDMTTIHLHGRTKHVQ